MAEPGQMPTLQVQRVKTSYHWILVWIYSTEGVVLNKLNEVRDYLWEMH